MRQVVGRAILGRHRQGGRRELTAWTSHAEDRKIQTVKPPANRLPAMRSFAEYAVDEGWSEDALAQMFIHDLPRAFHSLDREQQRAPSWTRPRRSPARAGTRCSPRWPSTWPNSTGTRRANGWTSPSVSSTTPGCSPTTPRPAPTRSPSLHPRSCATGRSSLLGDLDARGGEVREWVPEQTAGRIE